jgi:hypothetical protein
MGVNLERLEAKIDAKMNANLKEIIAGMRAW